MTRKKYQPIPTGEETPGSDWDENFGWAERVFTVPTLLCYFSAITFGTGLFVFIIGGLFLISSSSGSISCSDPLARREWRTLGDDEKGAYIQAVLCLTKESSILEDSGSLYDDLALTHMKIGKNSHFGPTFFPWHRMFLKIFETNLRTICGFQGSLPYWDWALDWQDLAAAPIFDTALGFGGDGNTSRPGPFDESYCVTEGPFSGIELRYIEGKLHPHCLSRSFYHFEDDEKGSISSYWIQPAMLQQLSQQPTYDALRNFTEYTAHNAIHWGIKGDFGLTSSANDPIFYLHHAQLDRLWWIWQQDKLERAHEYGGVDKRLHEASLEDELSFNKLWENLTIMDVMDADSELLCYIYW